MYKLEGVVVKVQLPQGSKLSEFLSVAEALEFIILQMKDLQLTQALESLVCQYWYTAIVQVEWSQMFSSNELVVDQCIIIKFVAIL